MKFLKLKELIKELMVSAADDTRQPSNNPFNDAAFAKGYRATGDAFRSLVGDGQSNEGIMEDIAAAMTNKDKDSLKQSVEAFDNQLQNSLKHWKVFKTHLESKL